MLAEPVLSCWRFPLGFYKGAWCIFPFQIGLSFFLSKTFLQINQNKLFPLKGLCDYIKSPQMQLHQTQSLKANCAVHHNSIIGGKLTRFTIPDTMGSRHTGLRPVRTLGEQPEFWLLHSFPSII